MALPKTAYLRGKGKVRIIGYDGPNYFRVLTCRDETVYVHRERLVFTR